MAIIRPTNLQKPFADSGTKNTIPIPSQIGVVNGAASYTDGFPPLTMTPIAAGGVPPAGPDFNGILNEISQHIVFQNAGGVYQYDSALATAVGGYPKGSLLLNLAGDGCWLCMADANSTDPDATNGSAANWMPINGTGMAALALTNVNITLTPAQFGKPFLLLTGALTGNVQLIMPALEKSWIVINNTTGAFTVTLKTSAGTGVVAVSGVCQIYGDGTNINSFGYAQLSGNASQVFRVDTAVGASDATPLAQVQSLVSAFNDPYGFFKLESGSPAFTKTAASTISIKAGTKIMVAGVAVNIAADTAVVMPALTAGTDYAIYACTDGTVRADASFTAPTGYTTETSRLIGGFHYGLVAPGTTVAGGSFATTGNGMIWAQADVDLIAGINVFSLWDLKWRAASSDSLLRAQKGFSFVNGLWVANYLCSTDHIANGLSKAGTNIASGTVLPKKPLAFGGDGTVTYPNMDWWTANEIVRAYGAKLMRESLFVDAAFGVTENQSIDATAATYPTTQRNAGYTSKYGLEQASGHHWTWGEDSSFRPDGTVGWAYNDVSGGRGQIYLQNTLGLVRVLLGGPRTNGVYSGSRCSYWDHYPWLAVWAVGVRAACDHLKLV